MILYHKLYSQNMVSAPFVAQADLGVTGDDREMRVNDRVLRITDTSRSNVNSKSWQAAVQKQRREMPGIDTIDAPDEAKVRAMVGGRKSFKSEVYSQPIDLKYGK